MQKKKKKKVLILNEIDNFFFYKYDKEKTKNFELKEYDIQS